MHKKHNRKSWMKLWKPKHHSRKISETSSLRKCKSPLLKKSEKQSLKKWQILLDYLWMRFDIGSKCFVDIENLLIYGYDYKHIFGFCGFRLIRCWNLVMTMNIVNVCKIRYMIVWIVKSSLCKILSGIAKHKNFHKIQK